MKIKLEIDFEDHEEMLKLRKNIDLLIRKGHKKFKCKKYSFEVTDESGTPKFEYPKKPFVRYETVNGLFSEIKPSKMNF
jgi:hypothetical protein